MKIKLLYYIFVFFLCVQFSFTQNTWTYLGNYGGANIPGTSCFVINNKLYYFHSISNGSVLTNDVWEFDPSSNIWNQKANYPGTNVDFSIAFSLNNKGYTGTGATPFSTNEFFSYNPTNNTWTQLNNIGGGARQKGVGFAVNNNAYIGLGNNNSKEIWQYNEINDTWTQKNNFPGTQSNYLCSFVVNNSAYLMGGDGLSAELWKYDDVNDSWTRKADYPSNARTPGAFAIENKGYAVGGYNNTGFLNELWMYNAESDIWTQKLSYNGISTERFSIGVANGFAFLVPIWFAGGPLNAFYKYIPSEVPTISVTNAATSISYKSATSGGFVSSDGTDTIISRGVCISTFPNPTTSDLVFKSVGSLGSFTTSISGLNTKTKYYLRSFATNSFGTSYGNEVTFNTLEDPEDLAPNNGDGNGDGVKDSQQDHVISIFNNITNSYLTVVSLDSYTILNTEIISANNENQFQYPIGFLKFKIDQPTANVKIYYHGFSSLNNFVYRKTDLNGKKFTFNNAVFGSELVNGVLTATATLTLADGGREDFDGLTNGSITDPGGPAYSGSGALIPIWDDKNKLIFVFIILLFGVYIFNKKSILI